MMRVVSTVGDSSTTLVVCATDVELVVELVVEALVALVLLLELGDLRERPFTKHDNRTIKKTNVKGSPYSITERRVPELIPLHGSQPAGDMSHKPCGRVPLLFARPAVTLATLKRAATNFAAR